MMTQKYDVGVVGLGYVGLTLSSVLAEVGLSVIGIEKRQDVVELTNKGKPHFIETDMPKSLARAVRSGKLIAAEEFPNDSSCETYIITVGTPLDGYGNARLDMIAAAARQVASNMADNALIILRSTVMIGTTRKVVIPILAESGKSFAIAMCPERTLEGRALQELRELPQIIGADSREVRDRAASVFLLLSKSIVQVSSLEAAEIVKLVDNTYRDVNFAFSNEVARICEAFSVSAHEVICAGKLGYTRTNVAAPGLVGGPCLEKDPHILVQSAKTRGIDLEIVRASRLVNERQPRETVDFIIAESRNRKLAGGAKVALLGMAFKGVPATDDLRGSMAIKVLESLNAASMKFDVRIFDPVIPHHRLGSSFPSHSICSTLEDAVSNADIVIIANNHPKLSQYPPIALREMMSPNGFIYDYWNTFSNLSKSERGNSYYAVGNTLRTQA